MLRYLMLVGLSGLTLATSLAMAKDSEVERFHGKWKVVELVEDGKVIPEEVISEWLPSGGRFTIAENALQFIDHTDGKKQVKLFTLDETQSPKGIDLQSRDKKRESWGIYRFDGEQLIVCLSDPEDTERPTSFSAKTGSKRMLLTLERIAEKDAANPTPSGPKSISETSDKTAKYLTDAESAKAIIGKWRLTDALGTLITTLSPDGTFSTSRELEELRLFKKTFVQTPISSGTWTVKNGQLMFHVTATTQIERLNHKYAFSLRSFSATDMIYVDPNGHVGRAIRVR